MNRIALSLSVLASLAVPSLALACEGHSEKKAEIQTLTVDQLAAMLPEKKAQPVDANGDSTRSKYGSIPGAILLTSALKFDAAKELPATKDSKLVFYCASTKCSAAKNAAERALGAGYTDVAILPVGISGWKEAGQKTYLPKS